MENGIQIRDFDWLKRKLLQRLAFFVNDANDAKRMQIGQKSTNEVGHHIQYGKEDTILKCRDFLLDIFFLYSVS